LGLNARPEQFKTKAKLPTFLKIKDKRKPEPQPSSIYITRVMRSGGLIKSPFYVQVDIPDGALQGNVIMKFETRGYDE